MFLTEFVHLQAVTSPSLLLPQDRTEPAVPRSGRSLEFLHAACNQWWPRWEPKFNSAKWALPLLGRSLTQRVPDCFPPISAPSCSMSDNAQLLMTQHLAGSSTTYMFRRFTRYLRKAIKDSFRNCLPTARRQDWQTPSLRALTALLFHITSAMAAFEGDFSIFGNTWKQDRKTNIPIKGRVTS